MLIFLCNSDKERNGLSLSLGTCGYYAYKRGGTEVLSGL